MTAVMQIFFRAARSASDDDPSRRDGSSAWRCSAGRVVTPAYGPACRSPSAGHRVGRMQSRGVSGRRPPVTTHERCQRNAVAADCLTRPSNVTRLPHARRTCRITSRRVAATGPTPGSLARRAVSCRETSLRARAPGREAHPCGGGVPARTGHRADPRECRQPPSRTCSSTRASPRPAAPPATTS